MTEAVDRLAGIIARGVVAHEGFACELTRISEILRRDGHHASADGMLHLSRHHLIRGMEGRGNLSALRGDIPHEAGDE